LVGLASSTRPERQVEADPNMLPPFFFFFQQPSGICTLFVAGSSQCMACLVAKDAVAPFTRLLG